MDDRSRGVRCESALDGEALTAYVAGRMGEPETEVFEQHYFSCEECWALLQAATAAQASFADGPLASRASLPANRPRRALIPAAALAAVVAGIALFGVFQGDAPPAAGEVFRGVERTMSLEASVEGSSLTARWVPVSGAVGYELRAYDGSGRLLLAIEVADATSVVDLAAAGLGDGSVVEVDVVALDGLGQVLLRSQRVALRP